jgi:hypothetical protein
MFGLFQLDGGVSVLGFHTGSVLVQNARAVEELLSSDLKHLLNARLTF